LILSGNTLYGTTFGGGSEDSGTVFAVNTDGTGFKILHSFIVRSEGGGPEAGLILSGNTLYGTANRGGSLRNGTLFAVNTDGTGFTILHSFAGFPSDGANLYGGLILSGNTLYGTTSAGGSSNYGTVFKLNTDSTGFTILHSFIGGSGGAYPAAGLILSCNTLYGTADGGGSSGAGTVFKLDITVGDIESLICLVETFNFTEGIRSSLDTKLQHAQAAIESGDFTSPCPNLRAFINEVQAQAGKKIPLSQASQLITAAEQIKAVVGCP